MAVSAIGMVCPDDEALDAFAAGTSVGLAIMTHVARCDTCRARVAQLESDNALIAEFRSAVVSPEPHLLPTVGGSLGDYRLVAEIGRGGQGVVYRAIDERTCRTVALKMLREGALASFHHRRRFDREIEIVAGLRHPGIVTLYEAFDIAGGGRGIAMEFIDGKPLDRWCEGKRGEKGERLSTEVLGVLIAVCDAVHHAHLRGVIHRDLKPSNILVDADGRPRVLDFGIAKLDDGTGDSTLTTGFVGSAGYAAPEQILGSPADVDLRADLFALGAIAYQVLCGALPFPGRGRVTELASAVRDEALPELPSHLCETGSRAVARDLDAVLRKALAYEPERRYRSAVELRDDLAALRDGDPVHARPEDLSYLVRRTLRRHRWAAASIVASALTLVLSTTTFAALWRGAEDRSRYQLSFDVMVQMLGTMNPELDPEGRGTLAPAEALQVREAAPRIERLITAASDDAARESTLRHGWAHLLSSGLRDHGA
ncbi:MAG: protein kinase, partial [Phycisphaerae bacterium]|nr:protein kinase [Phycisphaerae bacterium]